MDSTKAQKTHCRVKEVPIQPGCGEKLEQAVNELFEEGYDIRLENAGSMYLVMGFWRSKEDEEPAKEAPSLKALLDNLATAASTGNASVSVITPDKIRATAFMTQAFNELKGMPHEKVQVAIPKIVARMVEGAPAHKIRGVLQACEKEIEEHKKECADPACPGTLIVTELRKQADKHLQ